MIRSTARRVLGRVRRANRRILDWIDPPEPAPRAETAPAPATAAAPTPPPKPALRIRAEATPNPHAMKFEVGVPVGSRTLNGPGDAEGDPLGALFDLEGVRAVFAVTDFVTVLKAPDTDWDALVPGVERVLSEALA